MTRSKVIPSPCSRSGHRGPRSCTAHPPQHVGHVVIEGREIADCDLRLGKLRVLRRLSAVFICTKAQLRCWSYKHKPALASRTSSDEEASPSCSTRMSFLSAAT
eukprot:767894-Hanusia_phi.AAC.3